MHGVNQQAEGGGHACRQAALEWQKLCDKYVEVVGPKVLHALQAWQVGPAHGRLTRRVQHAQHEL